jgi:hypothetical protein
MKNNNKLFANYEISAIAKEKGFNEICIDTFDKNGKPTNKLAT